MTSNLSILAFTVGDSSFGIDLSAVEEVLPAAALTPLPGAPEVISGLLNLRGRALPVVDMSFRFRKIKTRLHPSQCFIIARTPQRTVVLKVDAVGEIMRYDRDCIASSESPSTDSRLMKGVIQDLNGLVLIHDIEACLTGKDEVALAEALRELSSHDTEDI